MNFEKLNRLLSLLANLGVIAGIVFLAMEVQQNTSMMQAQTRDSISNKLIEWQLSIANDQYTAQTFAVGNAADGFESIEQEVSYYMLVSSNFRIWENEYYQYSKGLYEEAEFAPRLVRWRKTTIEDDTDYERIWCLRREGFSEEFKEIMDSFVQEIGSCEEILSR